MLIEKCCQLSFDSMTSRADLNDVWASYAGPGGWNGCADNPLQFKVLTAIHS